MNILALNMKGNKGIFMKELIKKDIINEFFKVKLVKFFKEHGMFILVSLILLWVSLLLIQMADNYIMHDPTNQKETTIPTKNKKILVAKVREYDFDIVAAEIQQLIDLAISGKAYPTVQAMKNIVPEFKSKNSIYEKLDK